jgi:hypothetical protein
LWKFYQNKSSDEVLTPAHLLLLPLDNKKLVNFLDFNDIGSNTLKESMAFKKIKTVSKTITSNLVESPSSLHFKYKKINQTYLNDNSFLIANNYGLTRQHNLLSLKSNLNKNNVFLDKNSFEVFLETRGGSNNASLTNFNFYNNLLNVQKSNTISTNTSSVALNDLTNQNNNPLTPRNLLNNYPTLLNTLNDNSDAVFFQYPLRKLFNTKLNTLNINNKSLVGAINSDSDSSTFNPLTQFLNTSSTKKTLTLLSSNQNIQPADQNLRQYDNTNINKTNFNLEGTTGFKTDLDKQNLDAGYYNLKSQNMNENTFYQFMSNRTNIQAPFSPILDSTHLGSSTLDYDSSTSLVEQVQPTTDSQNPLAHSYTVQKSNNISILKGKRDGAPEFLSSSY